MFNKDPIVIARPHPAEQDFGYQGGYPANQKNASLRMRSNLISTGNDDVSSSALEIRSSSGANKPYNAYMRFNNLPNRSDFSPSAITSSFS